MNQIITICRSGCIIALLCVTGICGTPRSFGRPLNYGGSFRLILAAQATPPVTAPAALPSDAPDSNSHDKTESYTLSYETRRKAIAYSRSEYALYFVSYFVVIVGLLLLLRLGVVGHFRDLAQRATEKRWLQGLLFIPPVLLAIDLIDLPVSLFWHALSL